MRMYFASNRVWKQVLLLANGLFLIGLAYLIARPVSSPDFDTKEVQITAQSESQSTENPAGDGSTGKFASPLGEDEYQDLLSSDPFAVEDNEEEKIRDHEDALEKDESNFPEVHLDGTLAAGNTDISRAFLRVGDNGKQEIYRIGETVEGATITKISSRSITLLRDGTEYEVDIDVEAGSPREARSEQEERRRDGTSGPETTIVRRGGETEEEDSQDEERDRGRRGRFEEMDEEERERRREAMRERFEEALEDADPERREQLEERMEMFERRMEERDDDGERGSSRQR